MPIPEEEENPLVPAFIPLKLDMPVCCGRCGMPVIIGCIPPPVFIPDMPMDGIPVC